MRKTEACDSCDLRRVCPIYKGIAVEEAPESLRKVVNAVVRSQLTTAASLKKEIYSSVESLSPEEKETLNRYLDRHPGMVAVSHTVIHPNLLFSCCDGKGYSAPFSVVAELGRAVPGENMFSWGTMPSTQVSVIADILSDLKRYNSLISLPFITDVLVATTVAIDDISKEIKKEINSAVDQAESVLGGLLDKVREEDIKRNGGLN